MSSRKELRRQLAISEEECLRLRQSITEVQKKRGNAQHEINLIRRQARASNLDSTHASQSGQQHADSMSENISKLQALLDKAEIRRQELQDQLRGV